MSQIDDQVPVDDRLTVRESEAIYRTNQWWKAVVNYYYGDQTDSVEVAVYLWHFDDEDDDWTRKNKYVIKSGEAWQTDKQIIQQLLSQDLDGDVGSEYPVSDYYEVAAGRTISKENGWWKAILNVCQKGSYETDEVMIYLWQKIDDEWRRRQKYAIKDIDDWEYEQQAIDVMLDSDTETRPEKQRQDHSESTTGGTDTGRSGESTANEERIMTDINNISDEIDKHLSHEYTGGNE